MADKKISNGRRVAGLGDKLPPEPRNAQQEPYDGDLFTQFPEGVGSALARPEPHEDLTVIHPNHPGCGGVMTESGCTKCGQTAGI